MNRAIVMVILPPVLVAFGYLAVLRGLGLASATWPAVLVLGIVALAIWRFLRRGPPEKQN